MRKTLNEALESLRSRGIRVETLMFGGERRYALEAPGLHEILTVDQVMGLQTSPISKANRQPIRFARKWLGR